MEKIGRQVYTMHLWRTTWLRVIEAAERPHVPRTHLQQYLAATYGACQAVAIRRLCGDDRREVSFHNLLREIASKPTLLSNGTVDLADVRADLASLQAGNLKLMRSYVDQHLAHEDDDTLTPIPTFRTLHAAIDDLGALLRKYKLLVDDVDQQLNPILAIDWEAPMRVAWLDPWPVEGSRTDS